MTDPIKQIWQAGKLEPPKVSLALEKESSQQFIVIDDNSTIVRLMNQTGQVYLVAGFRCEKLTDKKGMTYYSCGLPMHPVTCKLEGTRDLFAYNNIKPRLFK